METRGSDVQNEYGSGKSTAVMHVFSNRKCVVTSTLPTDGESNTCVKDWASSVLDSLGIQNIPSGVDPLKILKESLVQRAMYLQTWCQCGP